MTRLVPVLFLFGCAITGRGTLYTEPSIPRGQVKVTRVAIVPNRLPANLTDPEKWRAFNWKIAAEEFRKHGYEVIDYDTSVKSFEKSGLPVEDTHSSRDKYALRELMARPSGSRTIGYPTISIGKNRSFTTRRRIASWW